VLALVVAYENNSLLFVYYVYYTLLCHIILKIEIMSNELMNLSVEQLRDLNKRKGKQQSVAFVNKEQLSKGMVAEYVGNSTNIHYKEFEIIKINRTKAECKCVVTGKLWTIQICNLKPTEKQLNYHTQLSTKQKNNLTIKAMVRIEMQLTEEEVAEQIAKEESRSRKKQCETYMRKMISDYKRKRSN
jgi:hypothetical protein